MEILGPPEDWQVASQKAQNNDSLVMRVSVGNTSALLEGDAEKKIERELVSENPSAQLLKVAHHGSASSTIPELLAATHPQLAVISVGYHNSFHHPRVEVLERLQQAGNHHGFGFFLGVKNLGQFLGGIASRAGGGTGLVGHNHLRCQP